MSASVPAVAPDPEVGATRVRDRALSLGFDAVGIASAAPPDHADAFRRWIEAGCAGSMEWIARNADRRCNPDWVVPGARSVVCLALSYHQQTPPALPHQGRIAQYAWGEDYHRILEPRLKELARWIDATFDAQSRAYVDTGPVLERDLAARAGLGWQGKSTMLLSRELGTWFFLAEIITTAALAPSTPAKAHCGKCTRCIDACPTGAITAPYQLDARRCIAYLTIEHRGPIPEPLRPAIGDRIFGCDACLEVCPWNRFAQRTREARLAPRAVPSLRTLLQIDDATFSSLFRHSPIRRIKRPGLLRNVCVALGNCGSPDDIRALQICAAQEDALVAEHALWAIQRIQQRTRESQT